METDINIEFYGLPGCGKTTVSTIVADELERKGYRVIRPGTEISDSVNPLLRRIRKICRTSVVCVKHPKVILEVDRIVRVNGYNNLLPRLKQDINIAIKLYYYLNNNGALVIWDQGITQAAISLAVNGKISGCENENKLLSLCDSFNIIHIYISEEIDTVLKRMESRESNNSRVEKEKNTMLKRKMLNEILKACDSIDANVMVFGKGRKPKAIAEEILGKCGK